MEKLALKMAIAGVFMIVVGLLYGFLAPSPVDVLIDDYRDGYAPKNIGSSTHATSSKKVEDGTESHDGSRDGDVEAEDEIHMETE